ALGGSGRRWWFVDGRPLGDSAMDAPFSHAFEPGQHQLSVLDEAGQTARVQFEVTR
ncbi:hypothetical protein N7333_15165, partial [Pseudomonas sp. GD04158]